MEDDGILSTGAPVALRKESVDRNLISPLPRSGTVKSLSARRAWIEIAAGPAVGGSARSLSARRAWIEMSASIQLSTQTPLSLSARRAWIEINNVETAAKASLVALRKESVDRNTTTCCGTATRSRSLSARRAWIEISILQTRTVIGCGRSPQGERG